MFESGQRIHLVGIKGVGMTALAQLLQTRGCIVTGSDGPEAFFTDSVLKRLTIPVSTPFSVATISEEIDLVISSVAYYFDGKVLGGNVEVEAALAAGIPVLTYPQAIGEISKSYQVIAVAGSHGKSTTTAMLGWILESVGFNPNVVVGTKVHGWESNARTGSGPHLIVEADEYREAFLNYKPYGVIVTSIDYDHPDYFKTPAQYASAFKKLIDTVDPKGFAVIEGDHEETRALAAYAIARGLKTLTYGFSVENKMCRLFDDGCGSVVSSVKARTTNKNVSQLFRILFYGKEVAGSSPFPGAQYVLNSGAAIAAAVMCGTSVESATEAVATFPGTARRFEIVKQTGEYTIIDDYAHHPTAISITLEGVKRLYPDKKITVVFQPHMFSRTEALLDMFAGCFTHADEVGIMEIYPSARETSGPVSGKDLADVVMLKHAHTTYIQTMADGKEFVRRAAALGGVIVLMGAGNVNELAAF